MRTILLLPALPKIGSAGAHYELPKQESPAPEICPGSVQLGLGLVFIFIFLLLLENFMKRNDTVVADIGARVRHHV